MLKEIIVSEHIPEAWVVSRKRAKPVPPEVSNKAMAELIEGIKQDNLEMRQSRAAAAIPTGKVYRQAA